MLAVLLGALAVYKRTTEARQGERPRAVPSEPQMKNHARPGSSRVDESVSLLPSVSSRCRRREQRAW